MEIADGPAQTKNHCRGQHLADSRVQLAQCRLFVKKKKIKLIRQITKYQDSIPKAKKIR